MIASLSLQRAQVGLGALLPVEVQHRGDRARVGARHAHVTADRRGDLRAGEAQRRARLDTGQPRRVRDRLGRDRSRSRRCSGGSRSPWKLRSTRRDTDLLIPAANTLTNTTSASADHQRRGRDRGAARLADRVLAGEPPVIPRRRSIGQPITEASGRTSRGLNIETPNSTAHRAEADQRGGVARALEVAEHADAGEHEPDQDHEQRRRRDHAAAAARTPDCSASRSAAIGVTRVARSAGARAATSVTTMPITQRHDDRPRLRSPCRCWAGRSRSS